MQAPRDLQPVTVHVDPDLEDLVPAFLANRDDDVTVIRTALADGDFATIRRIGHSLKGAAAAYGFCHLSKVGGWIEDAALSENAGRIGSLVGELTTYLGRLEVVYSGPSSSDREHRHP